MNKGGTVERIIFSPLQLHSVAYMGWKDFFVGQKTECSKITKQDHCKEVRKNEYKVKEKRARNK
jgi:hypothetical protein